MPEGWAEISQVLGWENKVLDWSNRELVSELGACLACVTNSLEWDTLAREVVRGGVRGVAGDWAKEKGVCVSGLYPWGEFYSKSNGSHWNIVNRGVNNKEIFFSVCISQALARTYLSHRWSLFDLKFKLSQVSCVLFGDSQRDTVLGETSENISMFWGWFVHQTLPEHIPWTRPWQYSSDQGGMGTADIGAKSFLFCNVHNSNYCVVC